jgi:hypothetical protein
VCTVAACVSWNRVAPGLRRPGRPPARSARRCSAAASRAGRPYSGRSPRRVPALLVATLGRRRSPARHSRWRPGHRRGHSFQQRQFGHTRPVTISSRATRLPGMVGALCSQTGHKLGQHSVFRYGWTSNSETDTRPVRSCGAVPRQCARHAGNGWKLAHGFRSPPLLYPAGATRW